MDCPGSAVINYYTKEEIVEFLPFSTGLKARFLQAPFTYRFALRAAPPGCSLASPTQAFQFKLLQEVNVSSPEPTQHGRRLGKRGGKGWAHNWRRSDGGFRGANGGVPPGRFSGGKPCYNIKCHRNLDGRNSSIYAEQADTAIYSQELQSLVAVPRTADIQGGFYECCPRLDKTVLADPVAPNAQIKAAITAAILSQNATVARTMSPLRS